MRNRRDVSIAANPILIGAATLLVTVVGVFLAYNANNGLPFVPTYDVKVLVPDAAELVKGNDVRVGGKRIGTVAAIKPVKTASGRFASGALREPAECPGIRVAIHGVVNTYGVKEGARKIGLPHDVIEFLPAHVVAAVTENDQSLLRQPGVLEMVQARVNRVVKGSLPS